MYCNGLNTFSKPVLYDFTYHICFHVLPVADANLPYQRTFHTESVDLRSLFYVVYSLL
jgi:hypothetical protein